MAKEWFSHDYGTRNKTKMAALLNDMGCRGYGLFWVIIEMLHESRTSWLDLEEFTYLAIKKESCEDLDFIKEFIDRGISVYKIFIRKRNRFSSSRTVENISFRDKLSKKRSEAGAKASRPTRSIPAIAEQNSANGQQISAKRSTGEDITGQDITEERENREILLPVDQCVVIAFRDQRWVNANKPKNEEISEFNSMLERQAVYKKNPLDYKQHFSNLKAKGAFRELPNGESKKEMVI